MDRHDEILNMLKRGDEGAFRIFFDEYYGLLVLFATSILNDVDEAEDLVQECFVNFWISRRFEGISGSLNTYLHQMVKHSAMNHLRNHKRRKSRQDEAIQEIYKDEEQNTEEHAQNFDLLYETIDRLPEERRRIFKMICVEGLKYQEVSERLGISINTVKTQMGRAFKFLRDALKDHTFSMLLHFFLKK